MQTEIEGLNEEKNDLLMMIQEKDEEIEQLGK